MQDGQPGSLDQPQAGPSGLQHQDALDRTDQPAASGSGGEPAEPAELGEPDELTTMDPVQRDFLRELDQIKRTGLSVSQHLIQLCRRGDWLAVDNLLRFVADDEFDLDAVAQGSGWSPVMFATKENRVNIVERLLDIGFDVNAQATVSTG